MSPGRDGLDGPLLAGQALWDILGLPACPVPGGTLIRRGQRPTHWKEIPMKKPLENRRGWRWLLLLALCVGIVGAIFFLPHPVVQNVEETSIQGLQYQPQYGQEDGTLDPPTTLTDYDQAAVLACLSRYQEQRTLEKADGQEEDAGRPGRERRDEAAGAGGGVLQLWGRRVEIPHPKRKPPPAGPGEAVEPPRLCITPERRETGPFS